MTTRQWIDYGGNYLHPRPRIPPS